ncbi:MAG TPA: hypothetical protein VGN12_13125 [Pirellulales bacterium]|jgi:hypothetical protein
MVSRRVIDAEIASRKRQLRAEIAQSRAATRATISDLEQQRRRLTSWRTYVQQFPVAALGVSFGVGILLTAVRPGRRLPRTIATSLINWGLTSVRRGALNELLGVWSSLRQPDDLDSE